MKETKESTTPTEVQTFMTCVIVLSGLPLTGKTTLAEQLAATSNLCVVDVDYVREEIDEGRKHDSSAQMLPPEEEKAIMTRAYQLACQKALELVENYKPVIIAGTFSREEFKKSLQDLKETLDKKDIPLKAFLLTASEDQIAKRIEKRRQQGSVSNIDSLDRFTWAKSLFGEIQFMEVHRIDSPLGLDEVNKQISGLKQNF